MATRRQSIPPASSHRAGHYLGLHPEDQPYQSTFMVVQPGQAAARSRRLPAAELFPFQLATGVGEAGAWSRRPILPGRPLPTILMVVCLLMLVVSSLLAYIFLHKGPVLARPTLSVMPAQLRVNDTFTLAGSGFGMRDLISFTHDKNNAALLDGDGRPLQTHADDLGTFSVQVAVPGSWQVGQHFIYVLDTGKEQSSSVAATLIVQRASKAPPLQQLASSSP